MKASLEIYDPAMCCSTGVCGPDVDDALVNFAQDVKWLKSKGIEVKRFNLGQEPEAFKMNVAVLTRLQKAGADVLPVILVNDSVASEGRYPDRQELCAWLGIHAETGDRHVPETPANSLLEKLRDSVVAGDTAGMRGLFVEAQSQGIALQALVEAMQAGLDTRQAATQELVEAANALLGVSQSCCTPGGGCC